MSMRDIAHASSDPPLGGRPWWLYRCSQLGFTSISCLLLQVEVLGLAGFGYPLSGLLPWQEPGRQISGTEGSYPRQSALDTNTGPSSVANCGLTFVFDIRHPNRFIATMFRER
jgi:hypothetical protein